MVRNTYNKKSLKRRLSIWLLMVGLLSLMHSASLILSPATVVSVEMMEKINPVHVEHSN